MDDLVGTDWLAKNLRQADVVVVDASWHMPATGRKGRDEYLHKQAQAQSKVPEDKLVDAVHAVLARHHVTWQ